MRHLSSALLCLFAAYSLAAPVAEQPQTTIETIYETVTEIIIHEVTDGSGEVEEVAVPDDTDVPAPVVASDTGAATAPCECTTAETATETATDAASDAAATDATEEKMCSCEETDECRKESMDGMDACMEECNDELEAFGDKTEEYRKCFSKNKAVIVEAENCLFENKTEYCNEKNDTKYISNTNWDDLTSFNYTSTADKSLINNAYWQRDEPKYNKFQSFLHCTKHCIHKNLQTCSDKKGCAIQMPSQDDLAEKMKACTKKNTKISTAILTTCQCLAWSKGVKELQGSCVILGNSYYVDRA